MRHPTSSNVRNSHAQFQLSLLLFTTIWPDFSGADRDPPFLRRLSVEPDGAGRGVSSTDICIFSESTSSRPQQTDCAGDEWSRDVDQRRALMFTRFFRLNAWKSYRVRVIHRIKNKSCLPGGDKVKKLESAVFFKWTWKFARYPKSDFC